MLAAFFHSEEGGQNLEKPIESHVLLDASYFYGLKLLNGIWKTNERVVDMMGRLIEGVSYFAAYEELAAKWVKESFYFSRKHDFSFYHSA